MHAAAGFVVLDAVVHQVQQHAAHVRGAAVHIGVGEGAHAAGGERDAAVVRADEPQHVDAVAQLGEVERLVFKLHGAVLDFAHLQDVVDQREQMVGRHACFCAVLRDQLRVAGVQVANFQQADNAVERRADVVAHARQKRAFRGVGRLRLTLCGARAAQCPYQHKDDEHKENEHAGQNRCLMFGEELDHARFVGDV